LVEVVVVVECVVVEDESEAAGLVLVELEVLEEAGGITLIVGEAGCTTVVLGDWAGAGLTTVVEGPAAGAGFEPL
jgi:hypothetical protein